MHIFYTEIIHIHLNWGRFFYYVVVTLQCYANLCMVKMQKKTFQIHLQQEEGYLQLPNVRPEALRLQILVICF